MSLGRLVEEGPPGRGTGTGLGAEVECCSLKSEGFQGRQPASVLWSLPVASEVIVGSCRRGGSDMEVKTYL